MVSLGTGDVLGGLTVGWGSGGGEDDDPHCHSDRLRYGDVPSDSTNDSAYAVSMALGKRGDFAIDLVDAQSAMNCRYGLSEFSHSFVFNEFALTALAFVTFRLEHPLGKATVQRSPWRSSCCFPKQEDEEEQ